MSPVDGLGWGGELVGRVVKQKRIKCKWCIVIGKSNVNSLRMYISMEKQSTEC